MNNEINSATNMNNQVELFIDPRIYPMEAIYSTSYIFIDRAYVFLDGDPSDKVKISLKGKESLNGEELEQLRGEFLNELLNYTLRVKVTEKHKKVKEFIVSQALVSSLPKENWDQLVRSKLGGDTNSEKELDYMDDPLGIAIPWEEKYGEEKNNKDQENDPD